MPADLLSPRLRLSPTTLADAPVMLALLNSPKWLAFIGDRHVHTHEAAADYIRTRMLPQLERLGFSNYTVFRRADEAPVGICGLYAREGLPAVDIGFALLPPHEGAGYATEAARALLRAGFVDFGLPAIGAITTPDNTASQRVLTRIGLQFVRTLCLPGSDEQLHYYHCTAAEHALRQPAPQADA